MKNLILGLLLPLFFLGCSGSESENNDPSEEPTSKVTVSYILFGGFSLTNNAEMRLAQEFRIKFNKSVSPISSNFTLDNAGVNMPITVGQGQNDTEIVVTSTNPLEEGGSYVFSISNKLVANDGSTYTGSSYAFSIELNPLVLLEAKAGNVSLNLTQQNPEILLNQDFTFIFSHPVSSSNFQTHTKFTPSVPFTVEQVDDVTLKINLSSSLGYWLKYGLAIDQDLGTSIGRSFDTQFIQLFTTLDPTDKFPLITDEALLTLIQEQTFKYFWDFGHPVSGMARERNTSNDIVTTGGTGFGLMAMIVGVERGFITRNEAVARWQTIVNFLENADRFHGVWPHWMNGVTGDVIPFSQFDNGADLVETAFLIQGLLAVDQYLNSGDVQENAIKSKINSLWEAVEWDWFTKGGENVLYWHWSPNYSWQMNLKIEGHNETQIIYILAASSPTHAINKDVYTQGYARNGAMVNGNSYYNNNLPLGPNLGGPLFYSHYSYLGLDPRKLQDAYANYWTQNINHSLINYAYSVDNPNNYIGYSSDSWGLTASDNNNGYSAHSPTNDLGVITPTAAISSLPYTPTESMQAIRFFYYKIGDRIWKNYGFVDAFNATEEWYANSFLAIDQGPQIVMIENHRTGLIWDLFMQNIDLRKGLDKLGITYD
jgi:hypothetical protein